MQEAQPSPRDNPAASDEAGTAAAAPGPFVVTKEHRRFAEFADAVRRDIGNHRYPNVLNDHLRDTCAA